MLCYVKQFKVPYTPVVSWMRGLYLGYALPYLRDAMMNPQNCVFLFATHPATSLCSSEDREANVIMFNANFSC
jgi:hypothetical protein